MQYIHYKQVKQDKAPAFYIVCTLQIMIISFCILISSSVGSWIKDLITAVLLALFGIPVYFICKKVNAVRIMNSVLNAMAIGVCIGSLYNYKEISLQFADIIAPMAISIFLVIINNVILVRWERIGWLLLINLLIQIAAILAYIFNWKNNVILCGQGLFLTIFNILGFFAAMQVVKDKKDLWRIVSMMSLLGFGIIFVIVISIITESGDALGGIGSIFDGDFSRKKKKKKFF